MKDIFRKQQTYIILTVAFTLIGGFYWFQLRPSNIRKDCYQTVLALRDRRPSDDELTIKEGNNYYRRCLVEHGLKAEDVVK